MTKREFLLLAVIYMAFISLGLPDGILGIAWPFARVELGQPLERAGILTALLLCMSAASSVLSGRLLRWWGTGMVTFASGLVTGLALLGYALAPSFAWMVLFALPLGLGQGAVDSGLNRYVAEHYSARQMNWLHCFWGVGATGGPLMMTAVMGNGRSWREGYAAVSTLQLYLALLLLFSLIRGMWRREEGEAVPAEDYTAHLPRAGLSSPAMQVLAVLLFFVFAGVEFTAGMWLNSVLLESRGLSTSQAGLCVSLYYMAIMVGRFFSGIVVGRVGNMNMIRRGFACAFAGVALAGIWRGFPGVVVGVCLLGLGLSPVYPCLMHETPVRFLRETGRRLIGFQVGAACLGGSILCTAAGFLFARVSLECFFPLLLFWLGAAGACNEILGRGAKRRQTST